MRKKFSKIFTVLTLAFVLVLSSCDIFEEPRDEKPVLYLYPESETEVVVDLDIDGEIIHSYPKYEDEWRVTAYPDGTLIDENGQEFYALFWESELDYMEDFETGFSVAADDTAAFLEDALDKLGLNRREANEFIMYWLPRLEANPYNLVSFDTSTYLEKSKTNIYPEPDTQIVVQMTFKGMNEHTDIEAQVLTAPERTGFVAVEWGGVELR